MVDMTPAIGINTFIRALRYFQSAIAEFQWVKVAQMSDRLGRKTLGQEISYA